MPYKNKRDRLKRAQERWKSDSEYKDRRTKSTSTWRVNSPGKVKASKKRHYEKHKDSILSNPELPERRRSYREKWRTAFFELYGDSCSCCNENHIEFLTIEHKNGMIGQKRLSFNGYREAVLNYQPDMYETLCYNCNMSKGRYGYCPHQR